MKGPEPRRDPVYCKLAAVARLIARYREGFGGVECDLKRDPRNFTVASTSRRREERRITVIFNHESFYRLYAILNICISCMKLVRKKSSRDAEEKLMLNQNLFVRTDAIFHHFLHEQEYQTTSPYMR